MGAEGCIEINKLLSLASVIIFRRATLSKERGRDYPKSVAFAKCSSLANMVVLFGCLAAVHRLRFFFEETPRTIVFDTFVVGYYLCTKMT